ncbi:MAG TPA: SpoIIE family protein phosphatase [Pseudomonadota bacterium]|nr:SpoIIE family protein phosphatase [Pseudomonadota bacterium]
MRIEDGEPAKPEQTCRLVAPSDFASAQNELRLFARRHGLERPTTAAFSEQLERALSQIRRLPQTETLLTAARIGDGFSLEWTTSIDLVAASNLVPNFPRTSPLPKTGPVRLTSRRFSNAPLLQCVQLERSHPRETVCGDQTMVSFDDRTLRIAVADGLGHGVLAHEAASTAIRWLAASHKETLEDAVLIAHDNTATTRGATLGVAWLDLQKRAVSATTVGNVRLGIYRQTGRLWSPCGTDAVLGHGREGSVGKITVRVETNPLPDGALLLLFSDGLASQLRLPHVRFHSIEELGLHLFAAYSIPTDDASLFLLANSRLS